MLAGISSVTLGVGSPHAELKSALGCSDRIIREHLPEALNSGEPALLDVDRSQRAWRYRYPDIHT
jgi:hypothetical protein